MNVTQQKALDRLVMGWLDEAHTQILKRIDQHFHVSTKDGARDLVTDVDRETEQFYVAKIHSYNPHANILSEEGYGDAVSSLTGQVWFVDPIDGTMNFVTEHAEFATMLAVFEDGRPVLAWIMDVVNHTVIHGGPDLGVWQNDQPLKAPLNRDLNEGLMILSGYRLLRGEMALPEIARQALGFRIYGSAGISFMHVLRGQAVGYLSAMKPWDYAAGIVLAQTLHLRVGRVDGQPVDVLQSGSVVVATPSTYASIMTIEQSN